MARFARRLRRLSFGQKTALCMLFPPLGLTLLWNRRCRWHRYIKLAVTAVFMVAFVGAIAAPAPSNARAGGVEFVSSSVAVYGPEKPVSMESSYAYVATEPAGSVVSTAVEEYESSTIYVYASEGQECYHEYTCKYAFASGQRLTLYEATFLGYIPCGLCNPLVYGQDGGTVESEIEVITESVY